MRISKVIATRLIQEAIRCVWAAGDAVKLGQSVTEPQGAACALEEIEKAKLALLALIDLVDMPAADRTYPVERKIREAVHEMVDKITFLLDVPTARPRRRRKR